MESSEASSNEAEIQETKQDKKSPVKNDDKSKSKRNSVIDSVRFSRFRSKSLSVTPDYYISSTMNRKHDKPDMAKSQTDILHQSDAYKSVPKEQNIDDIIKLSKPSTSTALMPVHKDAECYNMNHKNRGKCVIFNHENFDLSFEKREGTERDAKRLEITFTRLGFDVKVNHDFTLEEIRKEIDTLSQYDHTNNDCLCIIILTHGQHRNLISAKDAMYHSSSIWQPFTANKCKTLAGKPKLFFFQACRGDDLDSGVVLSPRNAMVTRTDGVPSYRIPTHADFLLAYSSAKGFLTWRHPEQGTWYIQCICDVLDNHGTEYDLMTLLTMTARKVATEFVSHNPDEISMHEKKQVPSVTSTLIRSVYFTPKSSMETRS